MFMFFGQHPFSNKPLFNRLDHCTTQVGGFAHKILGSESGSSSKIVMRAVDSVRAGFCKRVKVYER